MITVHSGWADDFSSLGLCPLQPTECTIEEHAGGMYQLKMTHPMDDTGRWWHLQNYNIIKAPAPMRETPLINMNQAANTTVVRKVYSVDVNSRLRLRTKPSTSTGKIIGRYKNGTKVVRIGESGSWYKVVVKSGGATGWMHSDYLEYVGEETQTITGKDTPGRIVEPRQTREQLFRITSVQRDDANRCVYITAQHVFYDMKGQLIKGRYEPKNTAAGAAAAAIFENTIKSHDFDLYTDNDAKIDGEYTGRNVVSALLETDGIVIKSKARLIRDNFDVFLLKDDERDRGVEIRHGKNMTGAVMTEDVSEVTTTVVPVGKDKEGEPLYLGGTGYVDAPNAGDLPMTAARQIEYDVRIGDGEGEFENAAKARAELERLANLEFEENGINHPTVGLEVDFVALENTRQYAQYAALQAVHLYDIVRVISARSGIDAKVRVTGYVYNCLRRRFDSVTLGELFALDTTVSGYDINEGTLSGTKVIAGSLDGDRIRGETIQYAHITQAMIEQLNANSIAAVSGRFGEIAAGSITTDKLYASLAEIVTLMVKSINADNIETDELYAALADVILLRAQQITAGNIETDGLAAQYAEIMALLVENLTAGDIQADRLGAALAEFVTMYAGVGEFDFATIQNLVAKALSLEQASAENVYIKNLAVTSANLLSATLGKLVLKGDDGRYYRVFVGSDGSISTEEVELTGPEISAGQTAGGQQIVETMMNVGSLNATNVQASSAVINQILTTALTAEKITAADALIASATIPQLYTTSIKALGAGLDLSANKYIQLIVGDVDSKVAAKTNVFRSETAPDSANLNDLWIIPSTGYTYQLAADNGSHPNYYLDENGRLYYQYASGQTAYELMMDAYGDLYISANADFVAGITQDGTPALWERVKDSELADAAQSALDAAHAVQADQEAANQRAEAMAEAIVALMDETVSLQNQIDGNITSWFEYGVPTASNYPASEWTTTDLKNAHLGDLYYDRNTGYCYRWQVSGSTYSWTRISDTDVTKALADAAEAKDVADSKRRVFVATPTPPYDVGDLWVQGANGDIMRCQTARASGSYYASDWVKASKYTDDTKANQNAQIIAQHTAELNLLDDRITAKVEQSVSSVTGDLETQISASFSEVTQTVNELRVEMGRKTDDDELRTYLRYADGTVELGRSGSRYVSKTSDNGFMVLQDGDVMASIVQNTISAPVIEANRMFAIGGFSLKIGANGHLILA